MRKFLFAILLATVFLSVTTVYGDDHIADEFDISDKYVASYSEENGLYKHIFTLAETENTVGEKIVVTCDKNHKPQAFEKYVYQPKHETYKISKIDYKQSVNVAETFIKEKFPHFANRIKPVYTSNYIAKSNESYNVLFRRAENNIAYNNNYIVVVVDANSNEVTLLKSVWDSGLQFGIPGKIVDSATATQSYFEKIPFEPCYVLQKDTAKIQYVLQQNDKQYIDANNGTLLTLSGTTPKYKVDFADKEDVDYILYDKKIPYDQAYEIASKYAEEVMGKKFESCEYSTLYSVNNSNYYEFVFLRKVNGISFLNNGISIKCDLYGNITKVARQWDSVKFESMAKIKSEKELVNKVNSLYPLELQYILLPNNVVKIVYSIPPHAPQYFDGTTLIGVGEDIVADLSYITDYSLNRAALTLTLCGVLPKNVKLNLDANITVDEFSKYLSVALNKPVFQVNDIFTKEVAAAMIVENLGYGTVANKIDIFRVDLKDESKISKKYYGSVAIAKGLGIFTEDQFSPKEIMTYKTAIEFLYNLVN